MKVLAALVVLVAIYGRTHAQPACQQPAPLTGGPAYGGAFTGFADMNHDGLVDLVTIATDIDEAGTPAMSIGVRYRSPNVVMFESTVHIYGVFSGWAANDWWGTPTALVDVNGDGWPDIVSVNSTFTYVRLNNRAGGLLPRAAWSSDGFFGEQNFVADVDGDRKADLIAVTRSGVFVRRSTGSGFGPTETWIYYRRPMTTLGEWHFDDVTGDGRADAIIVDPSTGIYVRPSTGGIFALGQSFTGPFYAPHGTYFADVTGDGRLDAIAIQDTQIVVRVGTNTQFLNDAVWLNLGPFAGEAMTAFVNVDNYSGADLIMVNYHYPIYYRPSASDHFFTGYCG